MKMIIARGVPASGKSTWARAWVSEDINSRARISRDEISYSMFNIGWGMDEDVITEIFNAQLKIAIEHGYDTVIDNVNLSARHVKPMMVVAQWYDIEVEFRDFPISLTEARLRNSLRERKVDPGVIDHFFTYLNEDGSFPEPPKV